MQPEDWFGISPRDEREIRERALSHACYIAPELGAFADDDAEALTRLLGVAEKFEQWITTGLPNSLGMTNNQRKATS